MSEILKNEWVVNIGTAIISGIILNVLSQWFFKKGKDEDEIKQINLANKEVINLLTPYVADKGIPEKDIVQAIINSVARKYKVANWKMYSIEIFCEELIERIISDVYISTDLKEKYTKELAQYVCKLQEESEKEIQDYKDDLLVEYSRRIEKKKMYSIIYSFSISLVAFIFTAVSVLTDNYKILVYPFDKYPILLLPMLIILAGLFVAVMSMLMKRNKRYANKK